MPRKTNTTEMATTAPTDSPVAFEIASTAELVSRRVNWVCLYRVNRACKYCMAEGVMLCVAVGGMFVIVYVIT